MVTIGRQGLGEEPVISWVVDRGIEDAIEPEAAQLLVILILVPAALGNLDQGFNGTTPISHHVSLPYRQPCAAECAQHNTFIKRSRRGYPWLQPWGGASLCFLH